MADRTPQIETGTVSEIPAELLRQFLLGRLSTTEQAAFEVRLLQEDTWESHVRLAECELADDYAYGRLDEEDRAQCNRTFLVTGSRRRMIVVSSALRDRFDVEPEIENAAGTRIAWLPRFLFLRHPTWRLAAAAAFLALVAGIVWLIATKPLLGKKIMVWHPDTSSNRPRRTDHSTTTPQPAHKSSPSPAPEHQEPEFVTATLFPDSKATIERPAKSDVVVRLLLTVQSSDTSRYDISLQSSTGQPVQLAQSLTADNGTITFDVPASLLKSGMYLIRAQPLDNAGSGREIRYVLEVS